MRSLHTIFATLAALLVLLSSTSFMVGVHVCGGEVKEVAFLQHADGCGHRDLPPCHKQLMEDCCEDESLQHEGQGFEFLKAQQQTTPVAAGFVLFASPVMISVVIPESDIPAVAFIEYSIPIRSVDRSLVHRVFLI